MRNKFLYMRMKLILWAFFISTALNSVIAAPPVAFNTMYILPPKSGNIAEELFSRHEFLILFPDKTFQLHFANCSGSGDIAGSYVLTDDSLKLTVTQGLAQANGGLNQMQGQATVPATVMVFDYNPQTYGLTARGGYYRIACSRFDVWVPILLGN